MENLFILNMAFLCLSVFGCAGNVAEISNESVNSRTSIAVKVPLAIRTSLFDEILDLTLADAVALTLKKALNLKHFLMI